MNPLDIVLAGLFEMLGYTKNTPPDAPKLDETDIRHVNQNLIKKLRCTSFFHFFVAF